MPYLGNIPATNFSTVSYQDLTGGTGTSFTLDFSAGSAQDIEVFVNNVRQEPGVAYTVAGTSLTMTGSIVATDDFYVVFQGKAQQSVTHPSNSALQATTGTFSGALSATTGTFSGAVSMGANNITFSDGNGIDFSASAGSGATSSILDDYEEGTWTGTLEGSTTNPSASLTETGYYTKVGNLVFAQWQISNVNTTGASGHITVTGLPFTASTTLATGDVMLNTGANLDNATMNVSPYIGSNAQVKFYSSKDSVGWQPVLHNATTGVYIWFSVIYTTTA
jgi:hypothetical protein